MALINLEKNQKDLITKVVLTEGDIPTTVDTYEYKCSLYKKEGDIYYLYINRTQNTSQAPSWNNEGVYELIDKIQQEDSIETAHIQDEAITKPKVSYVKLAVTVLATETTGESVVDATITDGEILGYYPTGNQDQIVAKVEITGEAKAKITLLNQATADNTFNVLILKN